MESNKEKIYGKDDMKNCSGKEKTL